jgi:ABC-type transport system involved in cytochrome c biogenesis permease subunit
MLAVAVLTMGVIELLRRLQRLSHPAWLAVFYGIALLTGILLVLHDGGPSLHLHGSGITTSHVLMGAMALMALVCKMLLDRGVIVGSLAYLYPILLLGLSVQLLLFTDPGGMRP